MALSFLVPEIARKENGGFESVEHGQWETMSLQPYYLRIWGGGRLKVSQGTLGRKGNINFIQITETEDVLHTGAFTQISFTVS